MDASIILAILVAAAVFTGVQAVWGMARVAKAKQTVNNRLKAVDRVGSLADLVIELRKQRGLTADGKRRVTHVTEITGMEGNVVQMQDIFTYQRLHTEADGTVVGEFRASGLRPRCLDELLRRGINFDTAWFDPARKL